jgi:ribosomal protein S12 methylthiotransferase accessory factor YcaO
MITIKREFIQWEDGLVEVIEKYSSHRIKDANGLKTLLECDVVLRKDDITYICRKVSEAELVEDEVNELPN